MVAPQRHPVYLLNNYVWALLKKNTTMTEADYKDPDAPGGRVPIIPSGQEPVFNAINKAYLVYGYSEDTTADVHVNRSGSLSYAIWSTSIGEVNTLLNIIKGAMERHDETARAVNKYTSNIPTYLGIRFGDIYIGYHEGPSPEETEGGRHAGIITIRYQYCSDIDVILP